MNEKEKLKLKLKEDKKKLMEALEKGEHNFGSYSQGWGVFSKRGNLSIVWEYKTSGLYLNIGGTPTMLNAAKVESEKKRWHIQIMIGENDSNLEKIIKEIQSNGFEVEPTLNFKYAKPINGYRFMVEKKYPLISSDSAETIKNANSVIKKYIENDWQELINAITTKL